jgi:hypothetical protein
MYSVRPLLISLTARDAIEDLLTEFMSALSIPQHQQVLNAFSQLDLISQGSQWLKLFQLSLNTYCLVVLLYSLHCLHS